MKHWRALNYKVFLLTSYTTLTTGFFIKKHITLFLLLLNDIQGHLVISGASSFFPIHSGENADVVIANLYE